MNNKIMYYDLSAVEYEIYNALQHNRNVLVHCFEGKHRSAAVIEYFLMKRKLTILLLISKLKTKNRGKMFT